MLGPICQVVWRLSNPLFRDAVSLFVALLLTVVAVPAFSDEPLWKKHLVHEGLHTSTAIGGDFTGDGLPDVISNSGGQTRLFVAPDWKELALDKTPGHDCIHSEAFDVDGDGDLDWIGARYSPGLIIWLEQPTQPLEKPWPLRIADDQINGIHGLLKGDVDQDGKPDLIANSGQPTGPFANSAAWLKVPRDPHQTERWERFIFAEKNAPGLSHYLGFGDVNGDGRPDISLAAKGGPQAEPMTGEWFAWWEAPRDPKQRWTKHLVAEKQPGATNIMPADVNGDGRTDFIATRGHDRGVVWFEAPDWKTHVIHESLKEPHSLVVLDMDDDGDTDAATCGYGDKLAYWFENNGRGTFTPHLVARDQAAYDIRAVDMDRDGDFDLLIAGQLSKNVVWYENPRRQSQNSDAEKVEKTTNTLTRPILFDTPEADAILATLQIFPADNAWHQDVSGWPVAANSQKIVASIGTDKPFRYNPDMGFVLVPPDQARVAMKATEYPDESDSGPFPIPDNVPIEGWPANFQRDPALKTQTLDDVQRDKLKQGGDRHAIVVDPVNGKLFEFYQMRKTDAGWTCSQSSIFDLKSNKLRPDGWTSSDAAGLPIFPAIVRYDELQRGVIDHALRVTVRRTRRAYVPPATHFASRLTDPNLPRMGERLRLKSDFDITNFSPHVQVILKALKKHGMLVADNGLEWAISVAPDMRIPVLHEELRRIKGSAFEVVEAPRGAAATK